MANEPLMLQGNSIRPKVVGFQEDFSNITSDYGNDDQLPNLVDRNKDTTYETTGADDDTTTVTLEFVFYEGPNTVDADFTAGADLIMLNHNFEAYTVDYWDGAAWQNIAGLTETANASADTWQNFTIGVVISKIRIQITKTIVTDSEKIIGEIYLCPRYLQFADALDSYDPSFQDIAESYRLARTDLIQTTINTKYNCQWSQVLTAYAEKENIKAVFDAKKAFHWIPEPEDYPANIFLVQWVSPWAEPYTTKYKGAGYSIGAEFMEV